MNIPIYFIFLETKSIGLHFAADNISLTSLNFYGELRKTILIRRGRFGHTRSSQVDEFGANRKRICVFLLVRNSNFGSVLHRFGATARFICC